MHKYHDRRSWSFRIIDVEEEAVMRGLGLDVQGVSVGQGTVTSNARRGALLDSSPRF